MKKIFYFLIFVILTALALSSFWIYQRYFKEEKSQPLIFKVERGDIKEIIKSRGEVALEKEFNLEFPFSGIIEKISVKEGENVKDGKLLMKLETKDFELETKRLESSLAQGSANLAKLVAGPTKEDLKVLETQVSSAQKSLSDYQTNLTNIKNKADVDLNNLYDDIKDILNDAYYKADDAVNKQTDEMFTDDQSLSPKLSFLSSDSQAKTDSESGRLSSTTELKKIKSNIDNLPTGQSDLDGVLVETANSLTVIRDFLIRLADAVNGAILSQTTITAYKGYVNTGRTNVNTAISNINNQIQTIASQKITNQNNISGAETAVNAAESALELAERNFEFKKAGARTEDIEIAKAQIKEIENQIATIKEKINKSALYSPSQAKVIKIPFEEKELFKPGQTAISLAVIGHKIQTDISELEIGKIRELNGNTVLIRFDAYPDREFSGRVVSIEPKEIIKDGDVYYRVNIYMEEHKEMVRSGMNADLLVLVSEKKGVLKIPEFAIYEKSGKKYVKILEGDNQKETAVEIGISDGESVEIISGLTEGQEVAVPAE